MSGQEDSPITLLDSDDDTDDVITDSITITRSVNSPPSRYRHSQIAAILTSPVSPAAYNASDSVLNQNKSSTIKQALVNGSVFYPQFTIRYRPQDVSQTQQCPSDGLSPRFHNPHSSTQRELPADNEQRIYQTTQIRPSDHGIQKQNDYAVGCPSSTSQCSQMMRQTTIASEVAAYRVTQKGTFSNIGDQKKTVSTKLSEVVEFIVDRSYTKPGTASEAAAEDPNRFRVLQSVSRASTPDSVIIESVEVPCVDSSKIPVTAIQASETLQAQIERRQGPVTPSIKILDSFSLRDCPINSKHDVEMASKETVAPIETSKTDTSTKPQPSKDIISPSVETSQSVKPSNHILLSDLCQKAFYQCCVGECEHSSVCPSEFQDHLNSRHPNAEEFLCVHCGDPAPSAQLLIQHLHHHADNNSNFHCNYPDCNFITSHPDSFTRHFYHCHDKGDRHLCLLCGQLFQTALEMLIHMKANFLNIVKCPHCSAKDVTKKNIMRHMGENHPDRGKLVTVSRQIVCRERLKNCWPMLQNSGRDQNTSGPVRSLSVTQDVMKYQVVTSDSVKLPPMVDLTGERSEDMSVIEAPSVCMDKFVPIMSVRGSEDGISVTRVKCENDLEENVQHCDEMPVLEQMKCATNRSDFDTVPRGAPSSFVKTETEDKDCDVDVKKDGIDSDHPVTRSSCRLEKDSISSESNTGSGSGKGETVKSERFVSPSSDARKNKSLKRVNVCSKCDFYTTSVGQIYKHVREVHKMEDMFQCSECHGYLCQDDVITHHVKYHPDADENYIPSALRHAFDIRYMKKTKCRQSSAQLEIGEDTSTSIDPVEDVTSSLMAKLSEAKEGDRLKLTSFESSILNKIINEKQITTSIESGHRKPDAAQVSIVKEATIPMVKPNQSNKKRRVSMRNKGSRKRQRLETQETTQEGTEDNNCQKELETCSGEADTLQEISEDDYHSDDDTPYNDYPSVKSEHLSPNRSSSASQVMSPKISKSPVPTPLKKTESPLEPSPKRNQYPLRGQSLKYQSPVKGPSPIKNKSPPKDALPISFCPLLIILQKKHHFPLKKYWWTRIRIQAATRPPKKNLLMRHPLLGVHCQ